MIFSPNNILLSFAPNQKTIPLESLSFYWMISIFWKILITGWLRIHHPKRALLYTRLAITNTSLRVNHYHILAGSIIASQGTTILFCLPEHRFQNNKSSSMISSCKLFLDQTFYWIILWNLSRNKVVSSYTVSLWIISQKTENVQKYEQLFMIFNSQSQSAKSLLHGGKSNTQGIYHYHASFTYIGSFFFCHRDNS